MICFRTLTPKRVAPLAIALALALAPFRSAVAGPPLSSESPQPESPEPAPLRIIPTEPSEPEPITFAEPPAPIVQAEPEPEPAPMPARPPVDSRRPITGTGLITFGGVTMGVSALMVVGALAGPGWTDTSRRSAAIIGGLAIPVGLVGLGVLVTGLKSNRKFQQWANRNSITPPKSGNGLLVAGGFVTLAGVSAVAVGTQSALTSGNATRADWAAVAMAGGLTTIGLVVLGGGMVRHSKFANWGRAGYLQPGTMAFKGGGGLTLSGRF